jgi:hypothetical protein
MMESQKIEGIKKNKVRNILQHRKQELLGQFSSTVEQDSTTKKVDFRGFREKNLTKTYN